MGASTRMRCLRLAAALLAAAAAAACADILAGPAADSARLALALQPGPPASQQGPTAFDEVDAVYVRLTRLDSLVVEGSVAVSPAAGEIRHTFVVPMERDEEELGLVVELRRNGVAVYTGDRLVRLVRGRRTTAEVVILPVAPSTPGAPSRSLENARRTRD